MKKRDEVTSLARYACIWYSRSIVIACEFLGVIGVGIMFINGSIDRDSASYRRGMPVSCVI